MKQKDFRQGEEGGTGRNHYPCDGVNVNVTLVDSETLFPEELLVYEGVEVVTKLITSHN